MYLSVCTRPDITHAVNYLSQFNNCYQEQHWRAAKRVLRYLKCTRNCELVYFKTGKGIITYVDADWTGDTADSRSYSGQVTILANAAVGWESKKQKTIALSTAEAEYMALSKACKEAIFVKELLQALIGNNDPIQIYCDNQSAIKLSSNPVFHNRTKHIDIRHHFVRECLHTGKVKIDYCPTGEMVAHILTKGLVQLKHDSFCSSLGLK